MLLLNVLITFNNIVSIKVSVKVSKWGNICMCIKTHCNPAAQMKDRWLF